MSDLSEINAFLVTEVLDDCLKRIQILGELSLFSKEIVTSTSEEFDETEVSSTISHGDFLYSVKELTPEEKLNVDRKSIETVLSDVVQELRTAGSYEALKEFNKSYKESRQQYEKFHKRALEEQQLIPKMKEDIDNAKQEMQKDIDDMDSYIHHLNFELQKLKAHFQMEKSYLQKECTNTIERTIKMCRLAEEDVEDRIERLKDRLEHEARADEDISNYWKQIEEHELLRRLEYWKFKFYDDQTLKERELHTLKKYKALNLAKMTVVSEKVQAAEDYIEQDRKEKQAEKERLEYEERKERATVQVQAWWRGVMVRRKLGPYAPPKKKPKKDKKGKKGKK